MVPPSTRRGDFMPQIWVTYSEAGDLFGCNADIARLHAINQGWARKKSGDGLSRVKLPADEADKFVDRLVQQRIDALALQSAGGMQDSPAPVPDAVRRAA